MKALAYLPKPFFVYYPEGNIRPKTLDVSAIMMQNGYKMAENIEGFRWF